jgi:long-chain acyl-CoA synthetase
VTILPAGPGGTPELDELGLVRERRSRSIPGAPETCAEVLSRSAADHPEKLALIGRSGRLTYAQLDEAVVRGSQALAALGVRSGDRVACTMANDIDIVVAFFATMRAGAIWVGINSSLAEPEKDYMVRDCAASAYLGRDIPLDEWRARCEGAAVVDDAPVAVSPHAPAAIAYTSGTTGFPKGAVHSHHNLILVGAVTRASRAYDPELRQGVCLPLTILNLMVLGPLTTFQLGATIVAMDRADPVGMAEWIEREAIQTFSAVPTMIHGLLTNPDVRPEQLTSLVRPGVGGADLPESFRDLYRSRFGAEVTIGYGLTEAPTAVTMTDPSTAAIPGEAGRALPQIRIVIVDDADCELPAGEVGEVCVAAATSGEFADCYTPMLGYWRQPEATRIALRAGMLHTGDLGYVDRDGHLFIKDRQNDVIIRGGANVYPAEVERVLHGDQRVEACAVVGYPDDRLGERVAAFVAFDSEVAASDEATVFEELAAACRAQLARYKVPERWICVDGFPRTPMGKIRRTDLRRQLADERRG